MKPCLLCLLYWQADSLPLAPHRKPINLSELACGVKFQSLYIFLFVCFSALMSVFIFFLEVKFYLSISIYITSFKNSIKLDTNIKRLSFSEELLLRGRGGARRKNLETFLLKCEPLIAHVDLLHFLK